jgi:hypothetical protein
MFIPAYIWKQLRVVITAITLLCVVSLNNREVTTFVQAPDNPTAQQVNKSAATERHHIVKQKVSLEATPSYLVLQLANFTHFLRIVFQPPVFSVLVPFKPSLPVIRFFQIFLSAAIQPNAP